MALIATVAALALPAAAPAAPPPYWQTVDGCSHGHRASVAVRKLGRQLKHHRPLGVFRLATVKHLRRCTTTRPGRKRTERRVRRLRAWRRSYAHRWPIKFHSLPVAWQNWAWATGACESGNRAATYTGNGFSGAFQFLPSTWWMAGGQGLPHQHSWHYQAWIAVHWRMRSSQSQWPNCAPW